jgi:DNA-binding CsgD family transcriptional regulator
LDEGVYERFTISKKHLTPHSSFHTKGTLAMTTDTQNITRKRLLSSLGLVPLVVGLAVMRSGSIVASYNGYRYTDVKFIADTSNMVALALVAVFILVLALWRIKLRDRTLLIMMIVSIALQSLSLFGLTFLGYNERSTDLIYLILNIIQVLGVTGILFFWIRQTLGYTTAIVVIVTFSSMLLSEPLILISTYLDENQASLLAAIGVLLQFPCLWAHYRPRLAESLQTLRSSKGFSFERKVIGSAPILTAVFIGFALTGLCLGFLRGYPDGQSIPFTDTTRLIQALVTMGVEAAVIIIALRSRFWMLIAIMWALLQTLIGLALVSFALFPDKLAIGAIFVTAANAFTTAFAYYLYSAFMNCFDKFDPYVYAFPIRATWLSARALSRVVLISLPVLSNNTILISTIVGFILLIGTQIVFMLFFSRLKNEASTPLMNAIGTDDLLDNREKSSDAVLPSAANRLSIRRGARKIGERFLLTEREIDVLILFAMGHKQERVASELYISPGTVHAHIKRIYKKTGFHSRQNILDYIKQYGEADGPNSDPKPPLLP